MNLHADGLLATPATAKVAVQIVADIAEVRSEPRDKSLHVQVGAMPAPLAHGIEAVVVCGQIAERFDTDYSLHLPIEARPAAEGKRAPIQRKPRLGGRWG